MLTSKQQRDRYLKSIDGAVASGDLAEARAIAEEAVAQLPRLIRTRDALTYVADAQGEPARALDVCARTAKLQLARMEKSAAADAKPVRKLGVKSRIFISGYFYSGSGAVLDYLRDYPGFSSWSPAGEMRLIKFPGGMADVVKRCVDNDGLDEQALVDFYLHIKGKKLVGHGPDTYSRWGKVNVHSSKLWRQPEAQGYLRTCLRCFLDLHRRWKKGTLTPTALRKRFRHYLEEAFNAAATDMEADYLLIDQAINAFRLQLARLVPPSTFIVVHRDPRDQYADAVKVLREPGRDMQNADEFSDTYRKRRVKAVKDIAKLEEKYGHRFLRLGFEDFVVDFDRVSKQVDDFVDIRGLSREGGYSVARSLANVGKYAIELPAVDVDALAAGNQEYLSLHAEAQARVR